MGQMGCREMSYSEGQKRFQPPRSTMCPQSLTIISQCNPYLLCPGSPNKALLQPAPFPSSALCAHQPQIPPKSPKAGSPSLSRAATGDIRGPAIPEVTANMQSLPGPGVSGCWRKPGTWRVRVNPPGQEVLSWTRDLRSPGRVPAIYSRQNCSCFDRRNTCYVRAGSVLQCHWRDSWGQLGEAFHLQTGITKKRRKSDSLLRSLLPAQAGWDFRERWLSPSKAAAQRRARPGTRGRG